MDISFTWGDPQIAQTVVKIWVETYINERTQALGRKSLYAFYERKATRSPGRFRVSSKSCKAV